MSKFGFNINYGKAHADENKRKQIRHKAEEYAKKISTENNKAMKWIKASERLPEMEKPVFLKIDGETMGMGNFYEQDQTYVLYVQRNGAHDEYEKMYPYDGGGKKINVLWLDESPSAPSDQPGVDQEQEGKDFVDYLNNSRDELVIFINKQDWNNELRTKVETFLIAYDQVCEKYSNAASRPAQGVEEAAKEHATFGENAYLIKRRSFIAGYKAGQSSQKGDAVEFAEWILQNAYKAPGYIKGSTFCKLYIEGDRDVVYTTEQLYKLFKSSPSPDAGEENNLNH